MLLSDTDLSEREFQTISDLVYRHCGINLHDGKRELVRARLAKRLRQGHYASASEYLEHVLKEPEGEEFGHLIDAISTNLTSFFREINHFHFLAQTFLPQLLERKRRQGLSRIRAWSAGCSSGEEPYSLAITLSDAIEDVAGWDLKILATDISTQVLATAANGVYEKQRIDPLTPQQRGKHLTPLRREGRLVYQVSPALRAMICFRHLNLMEPWPFTGPFDFIFCRNVMIYFDKPTQEKLVSRYCDLLEPGGMLFTGHSESLTGIRHRFKYVQPTIYAK